MAKILIFSRQWSRNSLALRRVGSHLQGRGPVAPTQLATRVALLQRLQN
jgi:hypothetical protein